MKLAAKIYKNLFKMDGCYKTLAAAFTYTVKN